MSNIRRKCPHCNGIYIGDGYKGTCGKQCYNSKKYETTMKSQGSYSKAHEVKKKKIHKHECKKCKTPFESNRANSVYCSFGCSYNAKSVNSDDRIKAANERWLSPAVPKKKSKWSIDDLNKMSEWKRVWDDESWTRRFNARRG